MKNLLPRISSHLLLSLVAIAPHIIVSDIAGATSPNSSLTASNSECSTVQSLLAAISQDSQALELFIQNPEQLQDRFSLEEQHLKAIKGAEILARDCSTCDFETGMTISA